MRPRHAACVLLTAGLLVTGCSGGDDPGTTAPPRTATVDNTDALAPAAEASTGPELADRLTTALLAQGSYRASVANPAGGEPAVAEARLDGQTMAIHATLEPTVQIIRIDGTGVWATDETTGAWTDGAGLGGATGVLDEVLFLFDLRSQLAGLAAVPTMNNLGPELLGGVTTTHYQGGAPAADFGNAMQPPSLALQTTGGDIAVDLWVDEQNRVVRYDYLLIPDEAQTDQPAPAVQRTDYSDHGADISVEPPALG